MHVLPTILYSRLGGGEQVELEKTADYWNKQAQSTLRSNINKSLNRSKYNRIMLN